MERRDTSTCVFARAALDHNSCFNLIRVAVAVSVQKNVKAESVRSSIGRGRATADHGQHTKVQHRERVHESCCYVQESMDAPTML